MERYGNSVKAHFISFSLIVKRVLKAPNHHIDFAIYQSNVSQKSPCRQKFLSHKSWQL